MRYISLFCLGLTGIAVLIAALNPAVGYEASIYASTPIAFWVIVCFSISVSIVLLARETTKEHSNRNWLFPLSALLANGLAIILLSVMRDYYAMGSDTLMHMGYVHDLANGMRTTRNFYPGIHMVSVGLTYIGVPVKLAVNLMPGIFYLIYVGSFYVLARVIWERKSHIIVATVLSATMLIPQQSGMAATLIAVALYPIGLVLLIKLWHGFQIRYLVAFVAYAVISITLHPLAMVALFISLVAACFIKFNNRWKMVVLMACLAGIAIYSSMNWFRIDAFTYCFKELIVSITSQFTTSPSQVANSMTGGITATQIGFDYSFPSLILRRYADELVLGLLAGSSILLSFWRKQGGLSLYFGVLCITLGMVWITGWYANDGGCNLLLVRMMYWIPSVAIICATPLIAEALSTDRLRKLAGITVAVVMLFISVYSVFNVYQSPFTGVMGHHKTNQQVEAVEWLIENEGTEIYIAHINGERINRYASTIYGTQWCLYKGKYFWNPQYGTILGFTYNTSNSIGWAYPVDVYLGINALDRQLPNWINDKLYRIQHDSAATLVYKDGYEIEYYFVKSYKEMLTGKE